MAAFQCGRCGLSFDRASKLQRHSSRKTPCDADRDRYRCRHCDRTYSHASSLTRHAASCQPPGGPAVSELALAVDELRAEVSRLRAEASCPRVQVVHAPNARTININAFGRENFARVTSGSVRDIFDLSLRSNGTPEKSAESAFLKTFRAIHSNIDHPEDITCYLQSINSRMANVHTESGKWDIIPYEEAARDMSARTLSHLEKNQPFENPERYAEMVRTMFDNEENYKNGRTLAPILYSNKEKLTLTGVAVA